MSERERSDALHARMKARRQRRRMLKTSALWAACAVLAVCLLWCIAGGGTLNTGGIAGIYSGSTMIFEDAGPYVLLATAAFMAGVIVTVILMRRKEKGKGKP